jgi:hypothetical protein
MDLCEILVPLIELENSFKAADKDPRKGYMLDSEKSKELFKIYGNKDLPVLIKEKLGNIKILIKDALLNKEADGRELEEYREKLGEYEKLIAEYALKIKKYEERRK